MVADASPARGRWAFRPVAPEPRSIIELIRAGTIDAELAATIWLLVEAGVPVLVAAAGRGAGKTTLLGAALDFVAPDTRIVELAGVNETFDWLPQASELGWPGIARRATTTHGTTDGGPTRPETTLLLVPEFSDHLPVYTWGEAARIAVRAASIGYGLAGTIHADSLDEVFAELSAPPVGLADDELSHLGVVLILRRISGGMRRVVAAHYVRPMSRDAQGHVQRLGPAVLATWNPSTDEFEHFGWGVVPELANRTGRRAGDFELETDARRAFLDDLATASTTAVEDVRAAIGDYRSMISATTSIGRPSGAGHRTSHAPH
jgi:hypothetical protein